MCTTNNERTQEGGSCNHNNGNGNNGNGNDNLYPRLSDLFQQFMGAPDNNGSSRREEADDMSREQAGDLLRDILANMVYGDQRPSAPPAAADGTTAGGWQRPNPPPPPPRTHEDECGEWFRRTFRARQCPTCHQHSNLPTTILSGFGRNIFTALTMLIPILIMPRIFLALGIFAFAVRSLGWPLKTFLPAALVFFVLMQLESTLITVVALAAVFKTCVLGRPLLDRDHWNARLGV